jgi:ubiquinone/menaquinone biosynthesis C-methylase UbiE
MMDPMTEVIDANIAVHTALSKTYNTDEPHFRPENQAKVKSRIKALAERTGGKRLLDVGCGTGFIIHLAADVFEKIDGVDITPAMMAQVDTTKGDITLTQSVAESLPFADNTFDAASAYSFLDHLEDYRTVLKEVARVLRPGGEFYVDLVPNRDYWASLSAVSSEELEKASAFVKREHRMVTANDKDVEAKYGIPAEDFRRMEPGKEVGGILADNLEGEAAAAGFSSANVYFDWFLGQAKVMHQQSVEDSTVVDAYLQEALPLTRHLYKYVWFVLRK